MDRYDDLLNNELERMWKEAVVAKSRYYLSIFLQELRKSTKNLLVRIAGDLSDIRTCHLPNTIQPSCGRTRNTDVAPETG
jgi:hypothetical protein